MTANLLQTVALLGEGSEFFFAGIVHKNQLTALIINDMQKMKLRICHMLITNFEPTDSVLLVRFVTEY